jgi:hypothetical protein
LEEKITIDESGPNPKKTGEAGAACLRTRLTRGD